MKVKTNVQGSSLHVSSDEQKADFISHSSSYTTHPPSINEKKSKLNFFLSVGIKGRYFQTEIGAKHLKWQWQLFT